MTLSISLEPDPRRKRQLQEHLTAQLPEWFGQRASNLAYAAQAEVLPGYVASVDGVPRGLLLKMHSGISAEIFWLGIDPACHRSGIGRALVEAVSGSARFLFVRTLHPRVAYEPYQHTRRFYEALGFRYVLEEQVPDPDNPLALYLKDLN
jgi:ribosomal protein S18 acetylase RimI-like enzyme